MLKLFPRILPACCLSFWPIRIENKTEPPMPTRVPKEESSVMIGAQTPAPAREISPISGIFPI